MFTVFKHIKWFHEKLYFRSNLFKTFYEKNMNINESSQ